MSGPESGAPDGPAASGPGADPRLDPRLLQALREIGADARAPDPAVDRHSDPGQVEVVLAAIEDGFDALYATLPAPDRAAPNVRHVDEVATSRDGHEVPLRVFRPAGVLGPLPCVVYLHGGGMAVYSAFGPMYQQWCRDLAATGLVVVLVGFRNAWSRAGRAPFPAGLDDCRAALEWVGGRREQLGVSSVVLQGESGGANLCVATALRAKQEGTLPLIDGVYACVPFVSGGYGWRRAQKLARLPSLVENDGYFLSVAALDLLASAYDPHGEHAEDPLCWPWFASEADLAGLPPHVVVLNELDPMRDEGVDLFRRLGRAGVSAVGRVQLGLVHGADLIFRTALSGVYAATAADVRRFAVAVSPGRV